MKYYYDPNNPAEAFMERHSDLSFNDALAHTHSSRMKMLSCMTCGQLIAKFYLDWKTKDDAAIVVENMVDQDPGGGVVVFLGGSRPNYCDKCSTAEKFVVGYHAIENGVVNRAETTLDEKIISAGMSGKWTARNCSHNGHGHVYINENRDFHVVHFESDESGRYVRTVEPFEEMLYNA
ncbi:hypothetical protein EMPS_07357 [Entomortierella parvispora]|uniref:Uncharacterized protein n=1 Tax=Entomortierella parvispora TaxID=205924 RepID=A0A9P3HE53_9FUNG|nr:hypothetical protein EMPS_07357 [Entomortierella parvispora]